MSEVSSPISRLLKKEVLTFVVLAFAGIVLLPVSIYVVGNEVFGEYAGGGFGGFFREIQSNFRAGEPVVIFLLLSPYLAWQFFRLSWYLFRQQSPQRSK